MSFMIGKANNEHRRWSTRWIWSAPASEGTEPLAVASESRVPPTTPTQKEIHRPAKIELLTRLLPQAVLYLRLPPHSISRILTRFDLKPWMHSINQR